MPTEPQARRHSSATVILSLALFFFTVPHNVEDFAYGEPARLGLPAIVIVLGLSAVFAAQGLALVWTGAGLRRGDRLHAVLGPAWAIAAVAAHTGEILLPGTYRTGLGSIVFLAGIVVDGTALGIASISTLRQPPPALG